MHWNNQPYAFASNTEEAASDNGKNTVRPDLVSDAASVLEGQPKVSLLPAPQAAPASSSERDADQDPRKGTKQRCDRKPYNDTSAS